MAKRSQRKIRETKTASVAFRRSSAPAVLATVFCLLLLVDVTYAAPAAPAGKPITATIGTASVGGQWYILGNGLSAILGRALPGSTFTIEPGDPIANIPKVLSGEYPLGFGMSPELGMAVRGEGPFSGRKVLQILALGNIAETRFITVVSKSFSDKYGIGSYADLGARKPPVRLSLAARGNITSFLFEHMLQQVGFPVAQVEKRGGKGIYQPLKSGIEAMKDHKIDMAGGPLPNPYSGIIDLNKYVPLVAVEMSDELIASVNQHWQTDFAVIPKSDYPFLNRDYKTFAIYTIFMVNPSMSNDDVYRITKAVYEHWPEVQRIHASLKNVSRNNLAKVAPAKLHPGAAKFYREVGLIK